MKEAGTIEHLIFTAEKLITSIADDNNNHGGLTSKATTRTSDEMRLSIASYRTAESEPAPAAK